jgi:hypothetical protein
MSWHDPLSKKYQVRGRRKTKHKVEKVEKENKYKAKKTALGFPSALEETHYADLLYREKARLVRNVERQVRVQLTPGVAWKCDFKCFDIALNREVWEESKGVVTERFALIKQLWPDFGPGLLRIYKGSRGRVWCAEEIEGKK